MMTKPTRAWLVLLPSLALPLGPMACQEDEGTSGGGDPVYSTREDLSQGAAGAGGLGGGGSTDPEQPIRICSPDIVILDDLPECFVAEVSSLPLDCTIDGHEELRPAWEDAARERECAYRSLDAADCAALSLCGIVKASGPAQDACQTGGGNAPAGYCAVDERTDGCAAAEIDSLFVNGVSPDAQALHISCATVASE